MTAFSHYYRSTDLMQVWCIKSDLMQVWCIKTSCLYQICEENIEDLRLFILAIKLVSKMILFGWEHKNSAQLFNIPNLRLLSHPKRILFYTLFLGEGTLDTLIHKKLHNSYLKWVFFHFVWKKAQFRHLFYTILRLSRNIQSKQISQNFDTHFYSTSSK